MSGAKLMTDISRRDGGGGGGWRLRCQALRMRHSFSGQFKSWSIQGCKDIVSLMLEWIVLQTSCQVLIADLKVRLFLSFHIFYKMNPGNNCQILLRMGDLKIELHHPAIDSRRPVWFLSAVLMRLAL